MTYTKAMYGMPPTKPGPTRDYYQASRKPAGALAVQCALEKTRADVHEMRREELFARVRDIQRDMALNPVKKTGPTTRKLLRGLGFGSRVDNEDESAYQKALRSMPNYEPLDIKQRARLYDATPYPFHTEESAQAFEEDRVRRQERRDQENANRYSDDAASRIEYRRTVDRKFETSAERESRMLRCALSEYNRGFEPGKAKYCALRDIDPDSDELGPMLQQLTELDEALGGPALRAAFAIEENLDPHGLAQRLRFISPVLDFRGRVEDFDMYTKPQYILYRKMEDDQYVNFFRSIIARYVGGEQLSDHELNLYALALEYEKCSNTSKSPNIVETPPWHFPTSPSQMPQETSDAAFCDDVDTSHDEKSPEKNSADAATTQLVAYPSSTSTSADASSDKPSEKATITAASRRTDILCFEVGPFVGDEYEAMCREADRKQRAASIQKKIVAAEIKAARKEAAETKAAQMKAAKVRVAEIKAAHNIEAAQNKSAQSKPTFGLKDLRRWLPRTSVKEIRSEGFPPCPTMSMSEMYQMDMGDRGIDNTKPFPLISPEKNKRPRVSDDEFSSDYKGQTSESESETVSPTKSNAPKTGEKDDYDFSFGEKGHISEDNSKTIPPIKSNTPQADEKADDNFSFDKDKASEIDVEPVSPIMKNASKSDVESISPSIIENVLETINSVAASLEEGKHTGKAVEDWLGNF